MARYKFRCCRCYFGVELPPFPLTKPQLRRWLLLLNSFGNICIDSSHPHFWWWGQHMFGCFYVFSNNTLQALLYFKRIDSNLDSSEIPQTPIQIDSSASSWSKKSYGIIHFILKGFIQKHTSPPDIFGSIWGVLDIGGKGIIEDCRLG